MKTNTVKISIFICMFLISFLKCNDNNLMDVYNKYTEHYRETPDDLMVHDDSCITVKVLNVHTNLPLGGTSVVLTMPTNDTISGITNNDGFSVFKLGVISKGTYSVKVSLYANNREYSLRNTYYLYEKNNPTLIIYINERSLPQ